MTDTTGLRAHARHPVPFRQFVLKVASRCNLACDYCYVYHGPDQSWRSRPRVMSEGTIGAVSQRIAEHVRAHGLHSVQIGLHGGEPLLAGPGTLKAVVTSIRAATPADVRVDLAIQTNGILLDEAFLRLFARHRVRISVSLDGDRAANDRHRRRANGRTSHPGVVRALRLLKTTPYRDLFAGLLCTIDLANDPIASYEALLQFAPPAIDFLLPHGNWSYPPPHRPSSLATPYADWLRPIFDHWYGASAKRVSIRMFDEVIHLLLGGAAGTESLGGGRVNFTIVETDGAIERTDSLKSAYPGAASTGLSVFTSSFDDALSHPAIVTQQLGIADLCETCQSCPVLNVCGGGLYAHRYRAGNGFRNPSVYSTDLRSIIWHISNRLQADVDLARGQS